MSGLPPSLCPDLICPPTCEKGLVVCPGRRGEANGHLLEQVPQQFLRVTQDPTPFNIILVLKLGTVVLSVLKFSH